MKKWIVWPLIAFLLLTLSQASAFATPETGTAPQGGLSIEAAASPNGEYLIYVREGNEWLEKGALPFDKNQSVQSIDLDKNLSGSGPVEVRIAQSGGGAGHIDSVTLGGKAPVSVGGDGFLLKKLSETDFDVINVDEKGIELEFVNAGGNTELTLAARIESTDISKTPFQFPAANDYKTIDAGSSFYKYILGSNIGSIKIDGEVDNAVTSAEPFFKEYCVPGSGHPSGFTYCWVMNDDENLYVTMDTTPDNTYDGDKDYAKVYARTTQGVKEFYLSVPETKWGLTGFTYTDKVKYQHKVYEFKIPLSELYVSKADAGNTLDLAFSFYGTASLWVKPQNITIHVGDSIEIFVKDNNDNNYTSDCSFSSEDTGIADVFKNNGHALLTGYSVGTTYIGAQCGDNTVGSTKVTVIAAEPLLRFNDSTYTVDPGYSTQTSLMLYNYLSYGLELPRDDTFPYLSFSSSDTNIATVGSQNGYVTGKSPGTVTITATLVVPEESFFDDHAIDPITLTATTQVTVTGEVQVQPSLAFSPDTYSVNANNTVQTGLQLHNYNGQSVINLPGDYAPWLSYASNNTDTATVDNTGTIKGINPGTATITAYFNVPEEDDFKAMATDDTTTPPAIFITATAAVTVTTPPALTSHAPAPQPIAQTSMDGKVLKTYYRGDVSSTDGTYGFEISEKGDKAELWILSSYLKEMKDQHPDGIIRLGGTDASYSLPLQCIDIDSALKDNYFSKIYITIEKVKDSGVIASAQKAIAATGGSLAGGLYDFSVYVDANGQRLRDLKNYDRYVERSLFDVGPFDAKDTTVMKFLPDLGSFVFSPSLFESSGAGNDATAKYRGNGIFGVVKNAVTFNDITGHWGQLNIEKLASRLIVSARQGSLFDPDENITRAEFAAMMTKAMGLTEEVSNQELGDMVAQLYKAETGATESNFSPDGYILRGEMSVVVCKALELAGLKAEETDIDGVLSKFKDSAKIGDNIRKPAAVCARAGIIVGRSNGEFAPDENTTRAEAAAIVERMLRYIKFIN